MIQSVECRSTVTYLEAEVQLRSSETEAAEQETARVFQESELAAAQLTQEITILRDKVQQLEHLQSQGEGKEDVRECATCSAAPPRKKIVRGSSRPQACRCESGVDVTTRTSGGEVWHGHRRYLFFTICITD